MLNEVFKTFIDDKALRCKLLDADHIQGWITAFTDETFDTSNNKTSIVQLGHNVLKAVLAYRIFSVFPKGDPALLSNMNIYFIEEQRQMELSQQLYRLVSRHQVLPRVTQTSRLLQAELASGLLGNAFPDGSVGSTPVLQIHAGALSKFQAQRTRGQDNQSR